MADTPRRMNMAAPGGNARGKRGDARPHMSSSAAAPPPPSGGLKFDPTMASSSYTGDAYATYQQQPYVAEDSSSSNSSNKRKRVKKDRGEDDWMPPPPPPPPPSMMVTDPVANMHMMPTILHRSSVSAVSAVSVAAAAPAPPAPPPFVGAYPSTSTTVFNEAPMEIRSFAETERRRQASNTGGAAPPSGALSHLVHAVEDTVPVPVSKPSRSSSQNGTALSWTSRGSGTMSVFDVFFPLHHRHKSTSHTTVSTTSVSTVRESKRRRRNQTGDASSNVTSTRSNRRNGTVSVTAPESPTLDLMRFAVDSFKLIPQGLVDRIDLRLRPDFVVSLIGKHVDNWVKRAGLEDQNFLQEITTLLNAYYPCNYATILDDVLVGFVFKRPELTQRMLQVMIERLQKTGESASPAKYPVIESFARRCGLKMASARDQRRHDLACLTVLRLLLERNTEKYLLSPWIASCASCCSEDVLSGLWDALLRPLVATGNFKPASDAWTIREPLDQVFELLREEKQLTRHSESEIPRLSRAMIKKIVQDASLSELRRVPVTCEAFEIFFGHAASHTTRFTEDWVASEEKMKCSSEEAVAKVIALTVENCARLSVKKTNWFVRHILPAVVTSGELCSRLLEDIYVQHAGLLLGGVEKQEMEELQPPEENDATMSGKDQVKPSLVVVGKVSPNEKNIEAGVIAQLQLLLEFLRTVPSDRARAVVTLWSDQWCQSHVLVPWSYVWGVVSCALSNHDDTTASLVSSVDRAFLVFAARFVKHYIRSLLERNQAALLFGRTTRIVKAVLQCSSSEACKVFFTSVLDAVASASSKSVEVKRMWSLLTTALADQLAASRAIHKGPDASPTRVDTLPNPHPRRRVAFLKMLHSLAAQDDSAGRVVRDELLVRRRLGMVLVEIVRQGDDIEAETALKILSTILRVSTPPAAVETRELCSASVVESVVAFTYRARASTYQRQAIAFLDSVSCSDSKRAKLLLWSVLRSCTSYCCGCSSHAPRLVFAGGEALEPASSFADLTKLVLQRSSDELVSQVGDFIQQHIVSCGAEPGRWNHYLVLVLDRVLHLGWNRLASAPRVVHLVVSPFGSAVDTVCSKALQLRLLKSLCLVLLSATPTKKTPKLHASAWHQAARLVASEQLLAALTRISTQCANATTASLSRSVALLCSQVKRSLESNTAS